MIINIKSKPLKLYHLNSDASKLPCKNHDRIARVLAHLEMAEDHTFLDKPGYRLHTLSGTLAGHWSVRINRNWRITFRFDGEDVCDVDLVDYH